MAKVAALIGDPARANMLSALMDGRALTAAELAAAAHVGAPTASAHLAKLVDGGLLSVEQHGRRRYFRLSGSDVAEAIEAIEHLAARAAPRVVRTGPTDAKRRKLRTCYDHLAGEEAVRLTEHWLETGGLRLESDGFVLTDAGIAACAALELDLASTRQSRRAFARRCLDWSERRAHLGGALGAAMLARFETLGWLARGPEKRAAAFTDAGRAGLRDWIGLSL